MYGNVKGKGEKKKQKYLCMINIAGLYIDDVSVSVKFRCRA